MSNEYPRVSGKYRIRSSIGYGIRDQTEVSMHHSSALIVGKYMANARNEAEDVRKRYVGMERSAATLCAIVQKGSKMRDLIGGCKFFRTNGRDFRVSWTTRTMRTETSLACWDTSTLGRLTTWRSEGREGLLRS